MPIEHENRNRYGTPLTQFASLQDGVDVSKSVGRLRICARDRDSREDRFLVRPTAPANLPSNPRLTIAVTDRFADLYLVFPMGHQHA